MPAPLCRRTDGGLGLRRTGRTENPVRPGSISQRHTTSQSRTAHPYRNQVIVGQQTPDDSQPSRDLRVGTLTGGLLAAPLIIEAQQCQVYEATTRRVTRLTRAWV